MPRLSFANTPHGPIVEVAVYPSTRSGAHAPPLSVRMLVDTGAPDTCIAADQIAWLGLPHHGMHLSSAGGVSFWVPDYDLALELIDLNGQKVRLLDPIWVGARDPKHFPGVVHTGLLGRNAFDRMTLEWSTRHSVFTIDV